MKILFRILLAISTLALLGSVFFPEYIEIPRPIGIPVAITLILISLFWPSKKL